MISASVSVVDERKVPLLDQKADIYWYEDCMPHV